MWVHFDNHLLMDYGDVLSFIYKTALNWAYELDLLFPKEVLEQVIKSVKYIDYESFLGFFFLWRFVSTRLPMPIPVLQRIVPSVVSHSDTLTKLIWLNMYNPPSKSTQARAIARMILLGSVITHRLNHICSSKAVEKYPSLKHFRNVANKHSPFHETLLSIVHAIRYMNFQPLPGPLSSSSIINHGACTRRMDTRTKVVEWGSVPLGLTPHKNVKKWYENDPTSYSGIEMEAHVRARECNGRPAYRVNPATKDTKGAGARSNCAECHKITNFYCLGCRRWLCSP